jgi:adenylate kinase family enzyme
LYLPKDGLNISRELLPQVANADLPDYFNWLKTNKQISCITTELPVSSLHPSQGDFNEEKIAELMTHRLEELKKPIIVSSDFFVLDGHHRWLALLNMDQNDTIPVVMTNVKIMDLLAATKEYPKSFTRTVVESFKSMIGSKHAVMSYARMNPPTKGHEKLIHTVHHVANEFAAHHEIVLSHKHDNTKNPLSQETKHSYLKQMFPDTNFVNATDEHPSIFHHATRLNRAGYKHLHVVAGDDRAKEFEEKLHKYNGHYDDAGNGYKFDSITLHSAGSRNPEGKGLEGLSGTKLRDYAANGNYPEFAKGVPGSTEVAKRLYNDVRQGLKPMNESAELLEEGVHDAAIFKAVFLAGAPGSGKDYVLKHALDGHGLTEISSDPMLTHLIDKNQMDRKMPEHEQEKRGLLRKKAQSLTDLRQKLALHGRNGIIVNGSGASFDQVKKIKGMLDELGYACKMIFVDTSDNVSRNRNIERGQKGGRTVPEKARAEKWRAAQDSRVNFSKLFGSENYHEFNNDEDLRNNTDGEVHKQKTKELEDLFKTVKKFTQQPPEHPSAQEWVHKNLGKLAKQPLGNKTQQKKQIPASPDAQATEDARKLGLQYYGYGRYGKAGRVTHFSLNGKLVEKKKALTPPKSLEPAKTTKKLDEAFEELFTEDNDERIRLENHMASSFVVGGLEVVPLHVQYLSDTMRGHRERVDKNSQDRFSNLREYVCETSRSEVRVGTDKSDTKAQGNQEEKPQETTSSFRGLMERLGSRRTEVKKEILKEGEPTQDVGGDGGPILGTGTAETVDSTNGGIATNGPKKTLKKFKGDIK